VGLVESIEGTMWDQNGRHDWYWLGRDEGQGHIIDTSMCLRWGDMWHTQLN